jgi:hypothetical protein
MNQHIYTMFADSVNLQLEANAAFRRELLLQLPSVAKSTSLTAFLMEFCTVKVDNCRRIGKSQFIADNAKANDLVIVPLYKAARNIKTSATVLPVSMLKRGDQVYDRIWVDSPDLVIKNRCSQSIKFIYDLCGHNIEQTLDLVIKNRCSHSIEFIYDLCGYNRGQTFIFLG